MLGRMIGLALGLLLVAGPARGQEKSPEATVRWLSQDQETALARSAAPGDVSEGATVFVMGKWGYEEVAEGSNGYTCYVDRGWSGRDLLPKCSDWSGTRSHFALLQKRESLRSQGKSQTEIQQAIAWAMMDGSIAAPRSGAITYMMSTAAVRESETGEDWSVGPRVLVHTPYADHPSLGMDDESGPKAKWGGVPHVDWPGGPMTSIVIPVTAPQGAGRDGSQR